MLSVEDLHAYYGKSHVLKGVTFEVARGEIACLLGRNGMGKTTTVKAIMGLVPARGGRILLEGRDLTRLPPHRVPLQGIAYVPQGRHIFPRLTVRENLELACLHGKPDLTVLDRVFTYFPRLKERLRQLGGTLSGGEQQMLAIGRALMAKPRIILLDEPTEGLMPSMVETVLATLRDINREGTTILLVEQNVSAALQVAHRVFIMQKGRIEFAGSAQAVTDNREVLVRYLGVA